MIRINLLPIRASRRQEAVKNELTMAGIFAGGVLLVLVGMQVLLQADISDIEAENALLQKQIAQTKNILDVVKQMEEQKAELEQKLSVIKQLKANKTGPVHMLDQLAQATPEKLQLLTLDEKDGKIELAGLAVSNEVISQFLSNLERSEYFTDVFLNEIDQEDKEGVKLKTFSITARLQLPGSAQAQAEATEEDPGEDEPAKAKAKAAPTDEG